MYESRLVPMRESHISPEQAIFRPEQDTTEQVLVLTSDTEAGFEMKVETGSGFRDLSTV